MSPAYYPVTTGEQNAPAVLSPPASTAPITGSVDFAHLIGNRLLVYGWILGFTKHIHRAFIEIADIQIDLEHYSRRVRRPDVSQHFSTAPGEEHGFYLFFDLQQTVEKVESLFLSIALPSGETHDSSWPIQRHDPFAFSFPQSDFITLRNTLQTLPALDRARLSRLLSQVSNSGQELEIPTTPPPEIQFEIDFCGVLDSRVLVAYGWLLDPNQIVSAVELGVRNEVFDLLKSATPVVRLDVSSGVPFEHPGRLSRLSGFILVQSIQEGYTSGSDAIFAMTLRDAEPAYFTRPLASDLYSSRKEILALINNLDVATGLLLIEKILSMTRDLANMQSLTEFLEINHDRLVERLPPSIQYTNRSASLWLHLDHAIPVASEGMFLVGWSYAEGDKAVNIFCHCGESKIAVAANWIRHSRPDVTIHLESTGVSTNDHEHGFTCYVPIYCEGHPYWLSMVSESGEERRMHVPLVEKKRTALQTVRALLRTFHSEHRQLRTLLDRQIGPAVEATWSARQKSMPREVLEQFGPIANRPDVSIIVPLYGRWDFAEYQMAQFVNDESFQNVELIYVVDDPSIYDKFRMAAPNLFGIYQLPFTIAFSGVNMGYAGANNFGASYARGIFILLLNSDVLPKRPGWLRDLVKIYETLSQPGLVGVKLLYEDGTLQHAGIEFRRHAPWGGLWINDHPLKGQVCPELKGVQEASAVTAACALIKTDLYRELGGLSEDYIIGDFEDSDLCLRARQAGRKNYVALDVELYHLERQSQNQTGDALWRSNLTAYNCWLHNKRWSSAIEEIVSGKPQSEQSPGLHNPMDNNAYPTERFASGGRP